VTGGTWRAPGQLIVYRTLFEMDWNATVEDLVILANALVPGWIPKHARFEPTYLSRHLNYTFCTW
jgi:hypothetical protein